MEKVLKLYDERLAKAAADFVELVSALREDLHLANQNFLAVKTSAVDNRKLILIKLNEGSMSPCEKCSEGTDS